MWRPPQPAWNTRVKIKLVGKMGGRAAHLDLDSVEDALRAAVNRDARFRRVQPRRHQLRSLKPSTIVRQSSLDWS